MGTKCSPNGVIITGASNGTINVTGAHNGTIITGITNKVAQKK